MDNTEMKRRIDDVKGRARGHWTELLRRLGVPEKVLDGRNQPCPMCGGRDRFRYTDKFLDGNYICSKCGAGDGFRLAEGVLKQPFGEVFRAVEEAVGVGFARAAPARGASPEFMRKLALTTWEQAHPVSAGDQVDRYLRTRGLGMQCYPEALRCHPGLGYYLKGPGEKKSTLVGTYPAMIARLQDGEDGRTVTLHRTYVQDGRKAPVAAPKKTLHTVTGGPAIRLFDATEELAVAEGIETALAVHLSTGKPVWAVYCAANMEKLYVPAAVRKVSIYADNDASFTGQAAAYGLARRLKSASAGAAPREVCVFVPRIVDTDWCDVWGAAGRRKRAA